jgi:hypothetical protein
MALDKRLQNPKRSQFDPTELEARLSSIEQSLKLIHDSLERIDWIIENHMEIKK